MSTTFVVVAALSCIFFNGFVNSDAYLDELAAKSIRPFCGNDTAQNIFLSCGLRYVNFGTSALYCGKSIFPKQAIEYSCAHTAEVGACILNTIPHDSDYDVSRVHNFHKCMGVDLSIPRIKEFNEYIKTHKGQ